MSGNRYRCASCGATFAAWAPAERHADAERHHRLEVLVRTEDKEPLMPKKPSEAKRRRQGQDRMGPPRPNTALKPPAEPPKKGRAA